MATSTFPTLVTGVTVESATTGAISGDGSSGNKLAVGVDGTTITVDRSNQLTGAGVDATITTAGLVGKTITVTNGIITGFGA